MKGTRGCPRSRLLPSSPAWVPGPLLLPSPPERRLQGRAEGLLDPLLQWDALSAPSEEARELSGSNWEASAGEQRPAQQGPLSQTAHAGPGQPSSAAKGTGTRPAPGPRAWAHSMGTPTWRGEAFGHGAGLGHSQGLLSPRYTTRLRQDWPAGLTCSRSWTRPARPLMRPPTPVGNREACDPGRGDRWQGVACGANSAPWLLLCYPPVHTRFHTVNGRGNKSKARYSVALGSPGSSGARGP